MYVGQLAAKEAANPPIVLIVHIGMSFATRLALYVVRIFNPEGKRMINWSCTIHLKEWDVFHSQIGDTIKIYKDDSNASNSLMHELRHMIYWWYADLITIVSDTTWALLKFWITLDVRNELYRTFLFERKGGTSKSKAPVYFIYWIVVTSFPSIPNYKDTWPKYYYSDREPKEKNKTKTSLPPPGYTSMNQKTHPKQQKRRIRENRSKSEIKAVQTFATLQIQYLHSLSRTITSIPSSVLDPKGRMLYAPGVSSRGGWTALTTSPGALSHSASLTLIPPRAWASLLHREIITLLIRSIEKRLMMRCSQKTKRMPWVY